MMMRMPPGPPALVRPARGRRWLLGSTLLLATVSGVAQTVAQQGPNPVPFSTTGSIDNRMVLTGASAQHPGSTTVQVFDAAKYGWIAGLGSGQYLAWTVNVDQGGLYDATLMVDTGVANQIFGLSVDGGTPASFSVASGGWTRANAGAITLPTGVHTIKLTTAGPGSASVKGLELLPAVDAAAYGSRVAAYKASTAHFSSYDYGLMFQYGAWGFPENGGAALPINQQAADFNVASFVSMVKSTGAKYVIWSMSWYTYQMDAPNPAVNAIVGETNRTATTDLVGNVAAALAAQGIDFYLYYHSGSDTQAPGGYDSTDWWQAQNWPATWSSAGWGNRSTFFTNWTNVVSTLGVRYGSLLKGWFFDDGGMLYYGGPFEALAIAARSGNSSRLLSYNSYVLSNITDFEDVGFGEVCNASGAPVVGSGQITTGPETGLQGHCMYPMENDWGIHYQGQTIGSTNYSVQSAAALVSNNSLRGVPTSFNMMMYQDGTVSPASLAVLQGVASYRGSYGCGVGCTQLDDTSLALTYSTGWQVSSNRGAGDFQDDVHYATVNGASVSLQFTGTSVSVFMPTNSNEGTFQVTIDGVSEGTYSAYASSSYTPRILVYSNGSLTNGAHTLTLTKISGTYLVLDYIQYQSSRTVTLNDTSPLVVYAGSGWSYSTGRNAGDFANDVHYTINNGDSFSVSGQCGAFTVYMPEESDDANVEFFIDGVSHGLVSTYAATYTPQRSVFSIQGLAAGIHTVSAFKRSGAYMQPDRIDCVTQGAGSAFSVNNSASAITYRGGGWASSGNRNAGDYDNDVSYTVNNGDSFSFTAPCSGFSIVMPKSPIQGDVQVLIDGVSQGLFNTDGTGYQPQQTVFTVNQLATGPHTISGIKHDSNVMQLDRIDCVSQ